jgi:hypothetical protein
MLGAGRDFDMVPFFWTKHFDPGIRYVGHAEEWDEMLIKGDSREAAIGGSGNRRKVYLRRLLSRLSIARCPKASVIRLRPGPRLPSVTTRPIVLLSAQLRSNSL